MPKTFLENIPEAKRDRLKANLKGMWYHDKKDCWVIPGHAGRYCYFKGYRIHRLSFALFIRDFFITKLICHKCDNPPCFNPDHLFEGDQKINMEDAKRKGRIVSRSIYKGNTSDQFK